MARTVEDVLARRTRLLFVSASAAKKAAPYVARWMAEYLGHDEGWQHAQVTAFSQLADSYCELPATTRAAGLKS
jgi:glycerol-3-phosphate dehydrogenase